MDVVAGYRVDETLESDGLVRRLRAFEKGARGFEREVRLHVLASLEPPTEATMRAFEAAAALAAELEHPCLDAPTASARTDAGAPVIVTAPSPGLSLRALIDEWASPAGGGADEATAGSSKRSPDATTDEAPLAPALLLRVGLDVARALAALHERGLAHGALRPEAIWIDERGCARLRDLALGAALGPSIGEETALLSAAARYGSPEQAKGEPATPASDRFTLASVLYELATGQPAFMAPTSLAITLKISMGQVPSLAPVALPDEAKALLARSWRVAPTERPDAGALVDALEDLVGREADDRRALSARVAAPADDDPLPAFAAFDDEEDDPTSLSTELPNYVPSDVALPAALSRLLERTSERVRAAPIALDDHTEPLIGERAADATDRVVAPAARVPAHTLQLDAPAPGAAAGWNDSTVRLVGDDPTPPLEEEPRPTLPMTALDAPPPPAAPPTERSPLFWVMVGAGAIAVVVLATIATVLLVGG